jgi:amidase
MSIRMRDYRVIAAQKQIERNNKIPPQWLIDSALHNATSNLHIPVTCGVLSDVECDITSKFDATTLLKKLKEGAWSAEQVTTAFCKRAAIAQQLVSHLSFLLEMVTKHLMQVNCLTEIFFGEAIERARHLDKERKENPSNVLPPLWGLPISLKDSFDILGHDSSTGLACYVGEPAKESSSLAAMLLDLGAVLYCKTNVSQLTIPADSDNNVFGRTLNPRNSALTAGGSTGGEGALIALRGSILGVGTDIGGSIRVPAVCNGIYGFRTSVGLIPHDGVRNLSVPGADGVHSSVGPMATSIRDCALFLRTIMESETWRYDSTIISLPWRNLPVKKKLCIGLVEDDGIYTPSPPVRRGLKKTADLLRNNSGVELVPITLPNTKEHYNSLLRYFSYPGSDVCCQYFTILIAD